MTQSLSRDSADALSLARGTAKSKWKLTSAEHSIVHGSSSFPPKSAQSPRNSMGAGTSRVASMLRGRHWNASNPKSGSRIVFPLTTLPKHTTCWMKIRKKQYKLSLHTSHEVPLHKP